MQLSLPLDGRSDSDKLLLQNEVQKVLYKLVLVSDALILGGFPLRNYSKIKKSNLPLYYSYIIEDKFITIGAFQALGPSEPAPWLGTHAPHY